MINVFFLKMRMNFKKLFCLIVLSEEQSFSKVLITKMIHPEKDKRPQLDEIKKELSPYLQ